MTYANMTNITGMVTIMQYSNTVTDGYFGIIVVILTFLISFFALKNYTTERALPAAGFITVVTSILLRFTDIIGNNVFVPMVILSTLALLYAMKN